MSAFEFALPDIGEGIAEAEIVEIHVQPGGTVSEDDPLVSVETDKAVVEIPSPATGTVSKIGVNVGDIVPVGTVLVVIDSVNGRGAKATPEAAAPAAEVVPATADQLQPDAATANVARPGRVRASPSVRRLASELGVDLSKLAPADPSDRVTAEDVRGAADAAAAGPESSGPTAPPRTSEPQASVSAVRRAEPDAPPEVVPLRGLRREIARRMVATWQSVPHIADFSEADATELIRARDLLRKRRPDLTEALTFVPLIIKIVSVALERYPVLNASVDGDSILLHQQRNIGVATATKDGLIVPVVKNVSAKSVPQIAEEVRDLVIGGRERRLTVDQLNGGTFTVNNIGALGGAYGTPILRSPEVAIMAFGRIKDQAVVRDGEVVVRPIMPLSTVADHRILDGDTLGGFTQTVISLIEEPLGLLEVLA